MTATMEPGSQPGGPAPDITFLELEVAGRCGLACRHCYASSGPRGGFGSMTKADWLRVIGQAAAYGILDAQLIGGEPTLHPDFAELLSYALDAGLGVEVYSNMTVVRPEWWQIYLRPKVYLACSYYSDQAAEHDAITRRRGSHQATRASIAEAVRRGIRIRAGIVTVHEGQRVAEARADLEALGVRTINADRMRAVGRGLRGGLPSVGELCGRCARRNAAVSSDGDVWGCTISRFLPPAGNVKAQGLAEILDGPGMAMLRSRIPGRGERCSPDDGCSPDDSAPSVCGPEVR